MSCLPYEPARTVLTVTQQKEEEDKKVARMKEMELRRQQIAEKRAEEEKLRRAEEEKKAKLEAEKRKREKEEDASKKPPVKPPTTTKKVSRDVSSSFRSHYELVGLNLRLRRTHRRSERWTVTVQLLNRSHHSRRSPPVSNKLNPSRSSRHTPL